MSRLWLPVGRWVFLGLAVLVGLIATVPLRAGAGLAGLDRLGLSAKRLGGVIWYGQIVDGRLGPLPIGQMAVRLKPLPLLLGRASLAFAGTPRVVAPTETGLSGTVTGTRNTLSLADVTGTLEAGALGTGLPVGLVTFTDFAARWEADVCAEAAGRVRVDLTGPVAGLPLGSLSGTPRCDGEALVLPLAGGSGRERLDLRIAPGGTTATLVVAGPEPALIPALTGAGFRQTAAGYALPLTLGTGG